MDIRRQTSLIKILVILTRLLALGNSSSNQIAIKCNVGSRATVTPKGDSCLNRLGINVTGIYDHTSKTFLTESDPLYQEIECSCNGLQQCSLTSLLERICKQYESLSVVRSCINPTSADGANNVKRSGTDDTSEGSSVDGNVNVKIDNNSTGGNGGGINVTVKIGRNSTEGTSVDGNESVKIEKNGTEGSSTDGDDIVKIDNTGSEGTSVDGNVKVDNNSTEENSADSSNSINKDNIESLLKNDDESSDSDDGDAEKDDKKQNNSQTKVIIIAVVSSLVFLAVLVAVTLYLMFFRCVNSPVYKGDTMRREGGEQQQRQLQQGEYDYVDESTLQALKAHSTGYTNQLEVIPMCDLNGGTGQALDTTVNSELEDYAEISSNESPVPIRKTSPRQSVPSFVFLPKQSGQKPPIKPSVSQTTVAFSSQGTKYMSHMNDSKKLNNLSGTSHTLKQILPGSINNFLPSASRDENYLPDYDEVDDKLVVKQNVPLTVSTSPDGIYSLTSLHTPSPDPNAADYHTINSITRDYAHLSQPGDEVRIIDNIYNG